MKTRIVMATGNAGKIRELSAVLSSAEVELIAQTDLNIPEVEENGAVLCRKRNTKSPQCSNINRPAGDSR